MPKIVAKNMFLAPFDIFTTGSVPEVKKEDRPVAPNDWFGFEDEDNNTEMEENTFE
jgi:2-keto-4-pentenoate hydratase/2-oxohepta-3-ene-1,7-dioic acid hydratase in catechol pathway